MLKSKVNSVIELEYEYNDLLSNSDKEYASVQEWTNGEGFSYFTSDNKVMLFSWDEFEALKKAVKLLEKEIKNS